MRDLKTLMRETRALKTDEARLAWVESLTSEEFDLFLNEGFALWIERARQIMLAFCEQARLFQDSQKPTIAKLARLLGEAECQPSQSDLDNVP